MIGSASEGRSCFCGGGRTLKTSHISTTGPKCRSLSVIPVSIAGSSEGSPYRTLGEAQFRLLRILPGGFSNTIKIDLSVCSIDEPPKYKALSYCWGTEKSEKPVLLNGHQVRITRNLDEALRHLRSHRKARTFWIDTLAIDQSNIEERGQQVQIMGSIYAKAAKGIVWIGSATEGSRYVMQCLQSMRIKTKSVPYFIHYAGQLLKRPWFYRVWTLQEILLASDDPLLMAGHELQPLAHFMKSLKKDKVMKTPLELFEGIGTEFNLLPSYWTDFIVKEVLGGTRHIGSDAIFEIKEVCVR